MDNMKQQVFDVLNEIFQQDRELFKKWCNWQDLDEDTIPDNILSLMLDFLEEQKWVTYGLQKITQDEGNIVISYCDLDKYQSGTEVNFTLVDGKYTDKDLGKYHKVNEIFYNNKLNKSRQVAVAHACVWVWKQQEDK